MTWNTGDSILGTNDIKKEANTIFTATFIGLVASMKLNRVDMELNMDLDKSPDSRTADDLSSMARLNNICSKVNCLVRAATNNDSAGIKWGMTPLFAKGGMITGGEPAQNSLYAKLNSNYLLSAWKYFVAGRNDAKPSTTQDLYIGRGAYCGLVVDADEGDALAAMPTIRTTLKQSGAPAGVDNAIPTGPRWSPKNQASFPLHARFDEPGYAWGMIKDRKTQDDIESQGMNFFGGAPTQGEDIVAYTHGMIRAIYEVTRIGGKKVALPYEMSIGSTTAKLASCMGCTFFMIANDYAPSSSHLGKSESWAPLYHESGHVHVHETNAGYLNGNLGESIKNCNDTWAKNVDSWMRTGVAYMMDHSPHVNDSHKEALIALGTRIRDVTTPESNHVVANLLLDALTVHESDAVRLDETLTVPETSRGLFPLGTFNTDNGKATTPVVETFTHDWSDMESNWRVWKNPLDSDKIRALFAEPTAEEMNALFNRG